MQPSFLIFWTGIAALASGFTIAATTGKGFLLAALPIILGLVLLHLITTRNYRLSWIIGFFGFAFVMALNHSRVGSIALVLSTLVLLEALRMIRREPGQHGNAIRLIIFIFVLQIIISVGDLVISSHPLSMWSRESKFLSFPRLKLWFVEPSYLGCFCVALIIANPRRKYRALLLVILALTQSYYAFVYLFLMILRNHLTILAVAGVGGVIAVAMLLIAGGMTSELFFSSSGLIRLIGLSIFSDIGLSQIVFGNGLGAGDMALSEIFQAQNTETANGFLFSFIYDVGLIGLFCYYLAFVRSKFDIIHLTFLLLNFGAGSFLLPIFFLMNTRESRVSARTHQPASPLTV